MAFCNQCGTALPDDARFCARCGAALAPMPETVEQEPVGTSLTEAQAAPQPVGAPQPWLPIVAAIAGVALVVAGFFIGLAIFDRDASPADESPARESPAADGADNGWTIAYVNDDGIQTLSEDGSTTSIDSPTGGTADWSPDHTGIAMLTYGRADMAYIDGFELVRYPEGTPVSSDSAAPGGMGMIDYYGWLPDSSGVEWSDLNDGFFRQDARTGAVVAISGPTIDYPQPVLPSEQVRLALEAAVTAALDPPASEGTMVNIVQALPSADGATLLVDVAVWRNTHLETAMMSRDVYVWMANADGSGARRVAPGHSPVWIDE